MSNDNKKWQVIKDVSQQPELTVERRLALLITMILVIACVALIIKALVTVTTGNELLEILGVIKSLLPYLITLLTPILHQYFRQKQGDEDDNCNSKD